MEAFERWQRYEFLDVERLYARAWRRGLAAFDIAAILANFGLSENVALASSQGGEQTYPDDYEGLGRPEKMRITTGNLSARRPLPG
jgi:hypothetical protein